MDSCMSRKWYDPNDMEKEGFTRKKYVHCFSDVASFCEIPNQTKIFEYTEPLVKSA